MPASDDEAQWRSYMKAKEAQERWQRLSAKPSLSLAQKEKLYRKKIRKELRGKYERYPLVYYAHTNKGYSDYAPEIREKLEKQFAEMGAQQKQKDEKALEEALVKHPEWRKYLPPQKTKKDQAECELRERIYQEEFERLKTLPPVRRNPIVAFFRYLRFKIYVMRHFQVGRVTFDPMADFGMRYTSDGRPTFENDSDDKYSSSAWK